MRIHFIYTNIGTCNDPHYHSGIGQLSALARRQGWESGLSNYHRIPSREQFVADLRAADADLYAFSSTTIQWPIISEMAAWAREAGLGPRILGGIHPTFLPRQAFAEGPLEPLWQGVFVGEADVTFPLFLDAFAAGGDLPSMQGVWLPEPVTGRPLECGHGAAVENLDGLPWADRSVFDMPDILRRNGGMFQMKVQRGCPYHCTYCSNAALLDMYSGKKLLRVRTPESVCDEANHHLGLYGFRSILFDDEMFTMFKPWTTSFCETYARKCRIPFMISAHFKGVNNEILDQLAEAGCIGIEFGFESGDPKFRKEVLRKYFTNEEALDVIHACQQRGIRVKLNNMYGSPGETEESIDMTIGFLRKALPDVLQATIYNPMPGTELFEKYEEENFAKPMHWIDSSRIATYNGVKLTPEQLHRKYLEFYDVFLHSAMKAGRGGSAADLAEDWKGPSASGAVRVSAPDGHMGLSMVTLASGARLALTAHPPARYQWTVQVPQDAVLRFEIGMDSACWELHRPESIRFSMGIERAFWTKALWSYGLSPKHRPEERTWLPFEVDLSEWAGKTVTLVFTTSAAGGPAEHATVYWGRPHIALKSREWRVFNPVSLATEPVFMRGRVDLAGAAQK